MLKTLSFNEAASVLDRQLKKWYIESVQINNSYTDGIAYITITITITPTITIKWRNVTITILSSHDTRNCVKRIA